MRLAVLVGRLAKRWGKHLGTAVATGVGIALAILVARSTDFATLRATVSMVGLAAPAVVAVRIFAVALAGLAWATLVVGPWGAGPGTFVGLRFVREAINVMLPVAAVGGDVVGGRLLTRWGVPPGPAAASILADLTVAFFTQLLFAALGIAVLALTGKSAVVVAWASSGLAIGILALTGFFAVQRLGFGGLAEDGLARLARRWPAASLAVRMRGHLRASYARPRRLAQSTGLHLASWLVGTLESFVVLAAIGGGPSLTAALAIESLGQAIRSSGSPVPGALGVQEGGYVVLAGLYGMPPETGLVLSLMKRLPDLVIGMAGLIAWLGLEAGRLGPTELQRAVIADPNEDLSG